MTVSVFVSVSVTVIETALPGSLAGSTDSHEHETKSEGVWDITISVVTVIVITDTVS